MRIDVETIVPAEPEVVWDLVADVTRVPEWSPECVHAAWLDQVPVARPGARFTGRNRARNGFEWTVTCVVTEADRPRVFAWVVLDDPPGPRAVSSSWRYELSPVPSGGTRVRESFTHGPGRSGLRWMIERNPGQAAPLIEYRRQRLRQNMLQTLAGMTAVAAARR